MNDVMFQGFHWFLRSETLAGSSGKLWQFLRDEADHLRAIGIDAVWIPPAYRGSKTDSEGYDVYDRYNIGEFPVNGSTETRYGDKAGLHAAIDALHGTNGERRIAVYADIVLNHQGGGAVDGYWEVIRVDKEKRNEERWGDGIESGKVELRGYTKFDYPERNNKYSAFQWRAKHFDSVDTAEMLRLNGAEFKDAGNYIYRLLYNEEGYLPHDKNFDRWVNLEKGNFDFLTSCDFDYGRDDVREENKAWGAWYVNHFNFDGVRLDAVKHISSHYVQQWLGHVRAQAGRQLFSVAEYIAYDTGLLHDYLQQVTSFWEFPQTTSIFDFPLFFKFNKASFEGEAYDLAQLFTGTMQAEQPALAVTFVENHDYEFGRHFKTHVEAWFKPIAYAFILLRQNGFPCVFFPDYYGSVKSGDHQAYQAGRIYIDMMIRLRKQFGFGEEVFESAGSVAGWTRLGFAEGAKGSMAVVINTAYNRVQSIRLDAARPYKEFYHYATIKWTPGGYLVVEGSYSAYGNKEQGLWTDENGHGEFPADGGSVSIWLEQGVGVQ